MIANEEDRKIVTEPYGGEEGSCKVYHDTAKIYVIRSEFSPMALELFTSRRQKGNHVFSLSLSKISSLLKSVCKDELKAIRNKATSLNRTGQ